MIYQNEFGVDEYYCTVDDNYRKDPNRYWHEKLNVGVNHSWDLWRFNYRFFYGHPYAWHLE